MKKTIIVFTIISILAKIIAFGRELVLSYFFGAGEISDVFLLSMTLPVTIFGFIAAGVTSGFIPTYQSACTEAGERTALKFTNNVINVLLVFCLALIIVYFVFSKQLLGLFASGFSGSMLELARQFTNFSIWATGLTAVVTLLSGYLQINDRIKITALVSVPLNFGVIITIITSAVVKNIYILPTGFLASSIAQVIFLWLVSAKNGFRYTVILDRNDKYLKIFLSRLTMLVLSGSMFQVNVLIDRTLATRVFVGGLSIFEYGNRINDFLMGLTIIPISAAIFPMMTKVKDDATELGKTLTDGIRLSLFVIIPASMVTMLFADVIVRILYYRGAFSSDDVIMTSEVVRFYGAGLLAFSLREMILKCFYAVGNVKSPVVNSSIGVVCNIILNFILLEIMGLGGLALATSISATISVILLYRSLKKHIKDIHLESTLIKCITLFAVTAGVCYGALLLYKTISTQMDGMIVPFLISMTLFGTVYIVFAILTGIINKNEIKALIKRH